MKRKIIALICVVASLTLALASCDNTEPECTHTFSEAWSSDANAHWHAATCEHGEQKSDKADHVDEDQDALCDVCEFNVGHEHSFAKDWSISETHHWKAPTCLHTDEKNGYELHGDEDKNGVCDVCGGHVHLIDAAGYCTGCGEEIEPIDETDVKKVIGAIVARSHRINGGRVDYYSVSRLKNENGEIKHLVDYTLGKNGTYSKREYDEVETIGEFPNAVVVKTGNKEILEKWIKIESADAVSGISAISVNGVYKQAEPSSYSVDDLAGYYFALSTLADGYGPEALLLAIATVAEEVIPEEEEVDNVNRTIDYTIDFDTEGNECTFNFKKFIVNAHKSGGKVIDYNAQYFVVSVSFSYSDAYELTSFEINCDCYTNDPGADNSGQILEEEIDLDYDSETRTFTMREGARADTYTIKVSQNVGAREELELNDGSEFAPDDFDFYLDPDYTVKAESVDLTIGNNNTQLYIKASPENTFFAFLKYEFDSKVFNEQGEESNALGVFLTGDVIYLIPVEPGKYTVEFSALGKTKTVEFNIEGEPVAGEHKINLTVTESYAWTDLYTFEPEKPGVYTFYFPAYLGVWEVSRYEDNLAPNIDFQAGLDGTPVTGGSITVTLKPGQTFSFYFTAPIQGIFTIGYDAP